MATVHIPSEKRTLTGQEEICAYLGQIGIKYEQWKPAHQIAEGASAEEVLAAYASEIERLKAEGGYVTADVIDVLPTMPGLDVMLNRFNSEHWHDEDEVRFIIEGRGYTMLDGVKHAWEAGDVVNLPCKRDGIVVHPLGSKNLAVNLVQRKIVDAARALCAAGARSE